MTKEKNLAKSIHDRLLSIGKSTRRPFNELLQLFAMERFLYRLGCSPHGRVFILKGGLMLRVWNAPITRPTRDTDLLGHTENSVNNLESLVRDVCRIEVEPDGLEFDGASVRGAIIKVDAEYSGVRVTFLGRLGTARVPMQLDVGFGDVVVPPPVEIEMPVLLDFPRPRLRAYQRETTIAEKFQALVVLGTLNTRMKDFYDLWLLSQHFDFDGAVLMAAVRATFSRRDTELDASPLGLSNEFAMSAQSQQYWSAFLRKSALSDAPEQFADVIAWLRRFLLPLTSTERLGSWRRGWGWADGV